MKATTKKTTKTAPVATMSNEEKYRANLAKALGKKPSEVNPVPVPVEVEKKLSIPETFGRNPFAKVVKGEPKQAEAIISAEVKKSKKENVVDTLPDGTPIETVYVDGAGKRIPEPKGKRIAISPLEMSRIHAKKEADELAQAKDILEANKKVKANEPVVATKKLKDMTKKERLEYYKALSAKALAAKRAKMECATAY